MRTTPSFERSSLGFLAMFDGPLRAIRCAMAIRDAVHALGIEVRGNDIGGIGVHIGARVSALRDLVIGSGLALTSSRAVGN
jgi:hypothetical protein